MNLDTSLLDHVQHLSQANAALQQAMADRFKETSGPRSWLARLADVVSDTPAEERLALASAEVLRVQDDARTALVAWLEEQEKAWLAEPGAEQPRKLRAALDHRRARLDHLAGLAGKAHGAINALDHAAYQCSTAQKAEVLDTVSNNKGFSLVSHLETEKAGELVDAARARMKELAQSLKQSSSGQDLVAAPGDMPDLAMDMVFDPGLDILSMLNTFALYKSEQSCRDAIDKIKPLAGRLDELKEKAATANAAALADYDAHRNPKRVEWISQLPGSLVQLLPREHLNPEVARSLVRDPESLSKLLQHRRASQQPDLRPSPGLSL